MASSEPIQSPSRLACEEMRKEPLLEMFSVSSDQVIFDFFEEVVYVYAVIDGFVEFKIKFGEMLHPHAGRRHFLDERGGLIKADYGFLFVLIFPHDAHENRGVTHVGSKPQFRDRHHGGHTGVAHLVGDDPGYFPQQAFLDPL